MRPSVVSNHMLLFAQSIINIVSDGGILMGPFLVMAIAWITSTVRYILNKRRKLKSLVALLLFPLAFGILAIAHWLLHLHTQFKEMEISGYPDVMEHIQNGLVLTRSGLVMVATGGISLVVTGLMFILPTREERIDDQT